MDAMVQYDKQTLDIDITLDSASNVALRIMHNA
jgi:hypothetical protein